MKSSSDLTNKNFKNNLLQSAMSAGVAVAVALPVSAAFSGGMSLVSAAPATTAAQSCVDTTKSKVSSANHFVVPAVHNSTTTISGNNSGNTGGSGGGTGSTNTGSQNTGATSANNNLVGVALPVSVNALNNDSVLNNSVNNDLSGNTTSVLNNLLAGATNTLSL